MKMAAWREQRMRALASGEQVCKQFRAELGGEQGDKTDIYLYDVIDSWGGYWGISASDIALALIGAGDVTVHVNSPGGEATEALAIYAQFRQHPGKVTMRIDGLAASAASMVAMAGQPVIMEPNAMMMIHDAWDIAIGNAAEIRDRADLLDKMSQNMATMYQAKAGGDADEWRARMTPKDTWYTAAEAVEIGLADSISTVDAGDLVEAAGFAAAWDLNKVRALYASTPAAPARVAPVPAAPAATIKDVIPAPAGETTLTIPEFEKFRAALKGLKR